MNRQALWAAPHGNYCWGNINQASASSVAAVLGASLVIVSTAARLFPQKVFAGLIYSVYNFKPLGLPLAGGSSHVSKRITPL